MEAVVPKSGELGVEVAGHGGGISRVEGRQALQCQGAPGARGEPDHLAQRLRAQFSREGVVRPSGVVVPSDEEAFLKRVLHVIEARMEESGFGVEALAEVGVSARQLRHQVRAVAGESPGELVGRAWQVWLCSRAPPVQQIHS